MNDRARDFSGLLLPLRRPAQPFMRDRREQQLACEWKPIGLGEVAPGVGKYFVIRRGTPPARPGRYMINCGATLEATTAGRKPFAAIGTNPVLSIVERPERFRKITP
jgi:hypothetical protein